MSRYSTLRAGRGKPQDVAGLRPLPHLLRGKARAYVGRALGQDRPPSWAAQGVRGLVFLGTGLVLGALALAVVS